MADHIIEIEQVVQADISHAGLPGLSRRNPGTCAGQAGRWPDLDANEDHVGQVALNRGAAN